jgi:WD40 repeat protein
MHEFRRTSSSSLLRSLFAVVLILAFLLSACSGAAPATTAPGETPSEQPAAQTNTPAATATATVLPTLGLPRLQGTAAPTPAGEINAAAAKNIVELARWGKGVLKDAKLSSDGKTLALSTATGVYLYDAATLDLLDSLDLEGEAAFSTQFSPDGAWLAVRSQSSQVRLYSLAEKQWGEKFGDANRWVSEDTEFYTFSPDGKNLAIMENDLISIINVQDGSRQKALETTSDWATIRYSGDGQHLVLVSRDYYAVVDLSQGTELVHQELLYIQSFAISPDGAYLVIGYGDWGKIYETLVLDANTGQEISRFRHSVFKTKTTTNDSIPDHLTVSPDSKTLAVAYGGSALCLWNLAEGKPLQCFEDGNGSDRDMAFTPDGGELFSYSDTSLARWDTAAWQIIERRAAGDVNQVLFPGDGDVFVTVGTSGWESGSLGQVKLWNADVKPLYEMQAAGTVRDVRYTPDGKFFLTASEKGIEMWDAQAGSLVKTLEGDATMLRVSWDGKILAAALADNSVQLFSLPDGEPTFKLEGHTQPVSGLFFDNKQMLVSVSSGETLAWKVDDGAQQVALPDAAGALTVLPTSDGFATLGADLKFSIWNKDDGELISTEARLAGSVAQPLAVDMNYYDNNLLVLGKDSLAAIDMNWMQRQWAVSMLAVEPALLRTSMTGKLLGVQTEDGLQILDPSSGNEVNKIKGKISAFDFEPKNDSPAVATAQENLVKVWSLTALPEKTVKDFGSSQYTSQLVYLPNTAVQFMAGDVQIDSDTLVIEKINNALRWFDTRNGNLLITAQTDRDLMAFSPNGKYYASVGTGQNLTPIVHVVDFQPDGSSETDDSSSKDNSTPEAQKQAAESGNDVQSEKSAQVDIVPQNIQNSWQLGTLSVSDNGRVAFAFDNTVEPFVELADGVSGEVLASFSPSKIMAALSADGKQLILPMANPEDEYAPIFTCLDVTDPQNASELWTLNWSKVGSQTSVTSLALSPDGKGVVFGDYNGDIFLVDAVGGETATVLKGHTDQVASLAFSSDGKTLYSSSEDGTIRVWGISDVPAFQPTPLPTARPYPTATSISAGLNAQFSGQAAVEWGNLAVITAENAQNLTEVMKWQIGEVDDKYHGRVFYFNHAPVGGAVFPEATSPNTYLIDANDMLLFDPFSNQPLQSINWTWTSGYTGLAPDGSIFAGSVYYPPKEGETEYSKPPEVQLIGADRAVIRSLKQHTLPVVNVLVYSPDGRFLITSATDFRTKNRSGIIVWDTQDDYTRVASLFVDDCIRSMAIEKRVDSAASYYQVFAGTIGAHQNTHLLTFVLTVDGELSASGGKGGFTVDMPISLAIAPAGQILAVGMQDGGLKIIGTDSDAEYASVKVESFTSEGKEENSITLAVTFLPDGKGILSSHWDGSLRLWGVKEK